jgi:HK97 family phage major capsid protein
MDPYRQKQLKKDLEAAVAEMKRINDAKVFDKEAYEKAEAEAKEIKLDIEFDRNQPGPVALRVDPAVPFSGGRSRESSRTPAGDKSFKGMFYGSQAPKVLDKGGFNDSEEFLRIVASGRYDGRLVNTFTEGVPAGGGFAVPEEMAAQWLDSSLPSEIIRPRAQVWPMKSQTRKVPAWDDFDHSDGETFGGLKMEWLGEGGTGTAQTGALRQIQLVAKKGAIFVSISNEALADGMGLGQQLEQAMKGAVTFGMDNAFIAGSGAGQPLGILNAPSVIEVSKETGQDAATINYENICAMFARMYGKGLTRGVWLANSTTLPQLMQLNLPVGTGGAPMSILKESADGSFSLLGRPVLFNEFMPALGSAGDICFCDLSQYYIGLRKDLSIDKSNAPGWTEDEMSLRVIVRFDGMPTWSSVLTPLNGDTVSWAVTLAARE